MTTYQPQPYELALRQWLLTSLEEVGAPRKVVFADQPSAPRPQRPFATIKALSLRSVGTPVVKLTGEAWPAAAADYTQRSTHQREGTASIAIFADDHAEVAAGVVNALAAPAVVEKLDEVGLTIRRPLSLVDATAVAGPTREGRTNLDIPFAFLDTQTHRGEAVEQANVTTITLSVGGS